MPELATEIHPKPAAFRRGLSFALVAVPIVLASALLPACSLTRTAADGSLRSELARRAEPLPPNHWPPREVPSARRAEWQGTPVDAGGEGLHFELTAEPVGQAWVVSGRWLAPKPAESDMFRTCVFHAPAFHGPTPPDVPRDDIWGELINLSPEFREIGQLQSICPLTVIWRVQVPPIGPVNGIYIRLRSIGPQRFETPLDQEMLRRGWIVLTSDGWGLRLAPRQRAGEGPIDRQLLSQTAVALEALHADWAYSTQAALMHVRDKLPGAQGVPVALVGCSFGALVSCPVAARISPDVMVLVGGGADALRTITYASREVFSGPGLLPELDGHEMDPVLAESMHEMYLENAPLDPYNVAPRLAGIPTLMLQGDRDGIIPSRFGDLLWERLGRPERWLGNYGHTLLFYFLPESAPAIATWIENAVKPEPSRGSVEQRN